MDRQLDEELSFISGVRKPNPDAAINRATYFNPEKRAEVIKLAESRKLPVNHVQDNLQEYERREKYDQVVVDEKETPKLYEYMTDEYNSQISIDDADNMASFEKLYKESQTGILERGAMWLGNRINKLQGDIIEAYGQRTIDFREEYLGTLRALGAPIPEDKDMPDFLNIEGQLDLMRNVEEYGKAVSEGEGYGFGVDKKFTAGRFLDDPGVANLFGAIVEEGPSMLADMAAAVYTPALYFAAFNQGTAEERAKNQGRDRPTSKDYQEAMISTLAVGTLERLSGRIALGKTGKKVTSAKDAAKSTGEAALIETGTEFLQEGAEYLGERVGTGAEIDFSAMLRQMSEGAVLGFGVGGSVRGTTSTIEALTNSSVEAARSKIDSMDEQEFIDKIISLSQSSATRERSPERFQSFVESLGSNKQIHISNEAIGQVLEQGIELPSYITDQLSGVSTDITISIDRFATDIAANDDVMGVIRDHIKLNPNTLTQSEMKEGDELSVKTLLDKANKEQEALTESEEIYNDVKDQIVDTERQGELTAKFSASLIPKWVAQKVASTGRSAKEIYEMMGLRVVGPKDKAVAEEIKPETVLKSTTTGTTYKQDFKDISFEEKRKVGATGKKVTIKQSAQRVWDREVKRHKQANKLKACLNG